jgi:hypothetical protein
MTQSEQSNESLAESIAEIAGSGVNVSEQDDIDKVMNEIEGLQVDMRETIAGTAPTAASGAIAADPMAGGTVPEPTSESDPAWLEESYVSKDGALEIESLEGETAPKEPESQILEFKRPTLKPVPMPAREVPRPMPEPMASREALEVDIEAALEDASVAIPETSLETDYESESSLSGGHARENEGSVTMNVQGNITVKLRHEATGQEIGVRFVGNQHIVIAMENGTEIKIPAKARTGSRRTGLKTVA